MKVSVTHMSVTPELLASFPKAHAQGMIAAANVLRNAVRKNLRGGYRSSLGNHGDFVTGNSLNHVTISEPDTTRGRIRVGTDLLYNLYWELGHHNLFTRHFERDERWRPAAETSAKAAGEAFTRVFDRVWRASAPLDVMRRKPGGATPESDPGFIPSGES